MQKIAEVLAEVDFEVSYIAAQATPEFPMEQVWVHFDEPAFPDQVLSLRLFFMNDATEYALQQSPPNTPHFPTQKLQYLRYHLPLSEQIAEGQQPTLAQLVLAVNAHLPFGYFGLSQNEGLYYCYMQIEENKEINLHLLVESLEFIQSLMRRYLPYFQNALKTPAQIPALITQVHKEQSV